MAITEPGNNTPWLDVYNRPAVSRFPAARPACSGTPGDVRHTA